MKEEKLQVLLWKFPFLRDSLKMLRLFPRQ